MGEDALRDAPEVDGLLVADGFDEAVIGKVCRFNDEFLLYDLDKVVEILMRQGCSYEEAVEFWDYNMRGAWVGEATPGYLVWRPGKGELSL
jgi:hypothetical protein